MPGGQPKKSLVIAGRRPAAVKTSGEPAPAAGESGNRRKSPAAAAAKLRSASVSIPWGSERSARTNLGSASLIVLCASKPNARHCSQVSTSTLLPLRAWSQFTGGGIRYRKWSGWIIEMSWFGVSPIVSYIYLTVSGA